VEGGGLSSVESLAGKGGQAARLFMSTRRTLNMLVKASRTSVTDDDRDEELARTVARLMVTGPFKTKLFVQTKPGLSPLEVLTAAGIDDARSTRLVVLDPSQFSLLNGIDKDTREAIRAVMGLGPNKVPVQWASSAVVAVVNTQGRAAARGAAAAYLAWDRVAVMDAVRADEELTEQARNDRAEAKRNLESAVRRAYRHFLYLGEGDQQDEPRIDRTVAFELDSGQSSLDGTAVWKSLVAHGKAFDTSALTAKALLHNLDVKDYGRPLDELRDLFWSSPRLPLLPDEERDLQRAIYEAVSAGQLRLVGTDDADRAVTRPADIAVGSSGLRLVPPKPTVEAAPPGEADAPTPPDPGGGTPGGGNVVTPGKTGPKPPPPPPPPVAEREITFSLMTSMADSDTRDRVRCLLLDLANAADDDKISWAQVQIKVIVATDVADELEADIRAAGTTPSSRDV